MIVGLLYEGDHDYGPLKLLIKKVFVKHLGSNIQLEFIAYCANGPTKNKLPAACTRFTQSPLQNDRIADFIVVHSDMDNKENAKAELINLRNTHQRSYPGTYIALALPEPHLEQWFFSEADALICYFSFSTGIPAVFGKDPKERLKNLIKEYADITLSYEEVYTNIADKIDIKKLCSRDPSFQYFYNDLVTTYNATINNRN